MKWCIVIQQATVTAGNTKLGMTVAAWSLPPGKEHTCPGETSACRVSCYAKSGFFRMPSTKDAHEKNMALSQQVDFVPWMLAKLRVMGAPVMRVHVSGDYYSAEYIRKWRQIVSQTSVQFYSYTRSWRVSRLLPELMQLSAAPNMHMWWSLDKDASDAPYVSGIRRAYMAADDADAAAAPPDCDLVFRVKGGGTRTIMKKANSVFVCPPENGVKLANPITCSRCGFCWSSRKPGWEKALWDAPDSNSEVVDILAT